MDLSTVWFLRLPVVARKWLEIDGARVSLFAGNGRKYADSCNQHILGEYNQTEKSA